MELVDALSDHWRVGGDAIKRFDESEPRRFLRQSLGLLTPIPDTVENRLAEIDARRRRSVDAALQAYRRECEAFPALAWLAAREGYHRALQRIVSAQAPARGESSLELWFDANRAIATAVAGLPLLKRARQLDRLYLTKQELRAAAASARRLRAFLRGRLDLPASASALLSFVQGNTGRPLSMLDQAARDLDEQARRPGRTKRNDATAVERAFAAQLAAQLRRFVPSDELLIPVICDLFDALGVELTTTRIAEAVRRGTAGRGKGSG
jgi:hypothetical protein